VSTCLTRRRHALAALSQALDPEPIPVGYRVLDANGIKNRDTYNPIWARPDARVGGVRYYPDFTIR
jgi:hypothetical protein